MAIATLNEYHSFHYDLTKHWKMNKLLEFALVSLFYICGNGSFYIYNTHTHTHHSRYIKTWFITLKMLMEFYLELERKMHFVSMISSERNSKGVSFTEWPIIITEMQNHRSSTRATQTYRKWALNTILVGPTSPHPTPMLIKHSTCKTNCKVSPTQSFPRECTHSLW